MTPKFIEQIVKFFSKKLDVINGSLQEIAQKELPAHTQTVSIDLSETNALLKQIAEDTEICITLEII